jgi:hypothetical protein
MKKAVLGIMVGGLMLPVASSAGRLNGAFVTQDTTAGADNLQCVLVEDVRFGVAGEVTATNGGCIVSIAYATGEPHKASAQALKGSKTTGNAKVSQSIETAVIVRIDQDESEGAPECTTAPYLGGAAPEKCKASGAMKGTEGDPDTTDSSKGSLSCELGENGSALVGPSNAPTTDQVSTITTAFGDRKDVKFSAAKKGKLQIKHKGAPSEAETTCVDEFPELPGPPV